MNTKPQSLKSRVLRWEALRLVIMFPVIAWLLVHCSNSTYPLNDFELSAERSALADTTVPNVSAVILVFVLINIALTFVEIIDVWSLWHKRRNCAG